jgi:hypothetical protein
VWGKNEAGSPKLGASTRARKERSIGSWDGKLRLQLQVSIVKYIL